MRNNIYQALKSKIANRIFWLIFTSACIPLITIFLISYNYISESIEEDTSHRIYRESRALGLTLYDRLVLLELSLNSIEHKVVNTLGYSFDKDEEWVRQLFDSIKLLSLDNNELNLDGSKLVRLNAPQITHIENGKVVLVFVNVNGSFQPILIKKINLSIIGEDYLAAYISTKYLYDLGTIYPDILTILNSNGRVIHNTVNFDDETLKTLNSMRLHESKKKNIKHYTIHDREYAVNGWVLFLQARFASDNLIISYSTPAQSSFSLSNQFKSIFPKTLIVTVLLVALLSISQVRKSLAPIEKLIKGTKNIAQGIYDKPVEIDSNDEFERLGESFNNMADQLGEQFKTLEMLSHIDRLILSSMDKNKIIKVLIQYLGELIDANHAAVAVVNDKNSYEFEITLNRDKSFDEIDTFKITLKPIEVSELQQCDNYLILSSDDTRAYTKEQKILGDKEFLIFPIKEKEELTGVICISGIRGFNIKERKFSQLTELFDRTAVALSNAAWEEKLYNQAHYDSLTNIPNRFLFKDRLVQSVEDAKRNKKNVVVMFIDLDSFKNINDTLGHSVGDEVISSAAEIIQRCLRNYDTIARFGGDEFLVILPDLRTIDVAIKKSTKVANRILERLSYPIKIGNRNIYLSASIGITIVPRDADKFESIMMNADTAMYTAKKKGKNRFEFFNATESKLNVKKINLENDLRQAINNDQLTLVYQPKIELKTKKICGVECLIRWNHPQQGYISPNQYIHIAEEAGLIVEIGYWVMEKAAKQNKQWQEKYGINLCTSVNVSPEQFRQTDFCENVERILSDTGLQANMLELEITENVTIENTTTANRILKKLAKQGVNITIDDFGTGYSSLSYLQKLPINRLKIDQSFIKDIPFNKHNVAIVNSIINLAHNLDMKVTAEGIETEEQLKYLNESECDHIQGYIICNPLTSQYLVKYYQQSDGKYIPDISKNYSNR